MRNNAQSANFALLFELFLESGYPVNAEVGEKICLPATIKGC